MRFIKKTKQWYFVPLLENSGDKGLFLLFLFFRLNFDNRLALIVTAKRTNAMGQDRFLAVGTNAHA